jgi:hypothetical protein
VRRGADAERYGLQGMIIIIIMATISRCSVQGVTEDTLQDHAANAALTVNCSIAIPWHEAHAAKWNLQCCYMLG